MGLLTHVEDEIKGIVIKVLVDLGLYSPPPAPTATTDSGATTEGSGTGGAVTGGDGTQKQAE